MNVIGFGYTGRTIDELANAAETWGAVIVDVRWNPSSRNYRWRKSHLAQRFGDRYCHVPELGNVDYKGDSIRIADLDAGLAKLQAILDCGYRIILLCVCRNENDCHRRVILDALRGASMGNNAPGIQPGEAGVSPAAPLQLPLGLD